MSNLYFHQQIDDIIDGDLTIKEKQDLIVKLTKELETEVRKGYTFCPKCKTYYRETSWSRKLETKLENVCVYSDPINSSGNEYAEKEVTHNYNICPAGHKFDI